MGHNGGFKNVSTLGRSYQHSTFLDKTSLLIEHGKIFDLLLGHINSSAHMKTEQLKITEVFMYRMMSFPFCVSVKSFSFPRVKI
jgi:hypothetical protein